LVFTTDGYRWTRIKPDCVSLTGSEIDRHIRSIPSAFSAERFMLLAGPGSIGQADGPWEFMVYPNSQGKYFILLYHDFICVYLRTSAAKHVLPLTEIAASLTLLAMTASDCFFQFIIQNSTFKIAFPSCLSQCPHLFDKFMLLNFYEWFIKQMTCISF